ncbi:hypothetical protein [Metallosphaera sp.]|uniref:hypothetical protein n=1 Tax=Metallosphaera sp. TaxID=2020860 RepID=UPI00316A542F|nr:hypothetical protein [Metallosphaera sedula]
MSSRTLDLLSHFHFSLPPPRSDLLRPDLDSLRPSAALVLDLWTSSNSGSP